MAETKVVIIRDTCLKNSKFKGSTRGRRTRRGRLQWAKKYKKKPLKNGVMEAKKVFSRTK